MWKQIDVVRDPAKKERKHKHCKQSWCACAACPLGENALPLLHAFFFFFVLPAGGFFPCERWDSLTGRQRPHWFPASSIQHPAASSSVSESARWVRTLNPSQTEISSTGPNGRYSLFMGLVGNTMLAPEVGFLFSLRRESRMASLISEWKVGRVLERRVHGAAAVERNIMNDFALWCEMIARKGAHLSTN